MDDEMSTMLTAEEAREKSNVKEVYKNAVKEVQDAIDVAVLNGVTDTYVNFPDGINNKSLSKLVASLYLLGYDVKLWFREAPELHVFWKYEENGAPVVVNDDGGKEDTELIAEMIDKEIRKQKEKDNAN